VLLPDHDTWLEADAARVAQILTNLLTNAARYTDHGGRITVEVRADGGAVHVTVSDIGIGFATEDAEKLFEMFARGDRSQGLGIGLALARRLAQMHGGSLTGSSKGLGQGATFTLSLPAGTSQHQPAAAERTRPGLPPINVLVVDDNRDAAETLQMLLDLLGVRARVAHEGPTALTMFETETPDAVLLDIGMPGMDGYEVARKLRARHPEWPGTLVALSGWGQEADRRKGQQAGFDHHLVKPVELDTLRQLLSNVTKP
jgi:CheY-like chemotaxis protein